MQLEKNLQGFAVTPGRTEKGEQRRLEGAATAAEEAKRRRLAWRRVMGDDEADALSDVHLEGKKFRTQHVPIPSDILDEEEVGVVGSRACCADLRPLLS